MTPYRIIDLPGPTPLSRILRAAGVTLLCLIAAVALVYVGDCALFYLRGKPADNVVVSRYLATPMKGNKTEYFYEGTQPMPCSRTLSPQGGMNPCWYVRRHPLYAENL